jgi:hypothetical protein
MLVIILCHAPCNTLLLMILIINSCALVSIHKWHLLRDACVGRSV